jgi:hypothetical protein
MLFVDCTIGNVIMSSLFLLGLGGCQGALSKAAGSLFTWWFVDALLIGYNTVMTPPFTVTASYSTATASHSTMTAPYRMCLPRSQKLWFPAKAVQFFLVPKLYHLLYINLIAFVWNIILTSIVANEARPRSPI